MKPEIKIEGDKLFVTAQIEAGIDSDKDGVHAAKITGMVKIELDGSEVLDEALKSSSFLQKVKDKLGIK